MKRLFRILLVTTTLLFLIWGVFDLLLNNPYSQKFFQLYTNKIISEETHLQVKFQTIEIHLLPFEIQVYGPHIQWETERGETVEAEASKIRVKISIASIMLGKPTITILSIHDLNTDLPSSFKGNFFKEKKQKTPSKIKNWKIENLSINHAQLLLNLPNDSRVLLKGLNIDSHFKNWTQFTNQISLNSLNLNLEGKDYLHQTGIEGLLHIKKDQIHFENVKFIDPLFQLKADLKGTLSLSNPDFSYLRLSGDLDTDANLEILEQTLGWKKSHGRASVDAKLLLNIPFSQEKIPSFSLEGLAQSKGGVLSDIKLHNSQSHFYADSEGIQFHNAKIILNNSEKAQANGYLHFNDSVDFDFKSSIRDFALSEIIPTFGPKFDVFDFNAFSESLHVYGKGDPLQIQIEGLTALKDLNFPDLNIEATKTTQKPTCYSKINIDIAEDQLNFNDTEALCFLDDNTEKVKIPKEYPFQAPRTAKFLSPITLHDSIHFDLGPQFYISSSAMDLGLTSSFFQKDIGGHGKIHASILEKNSNVDVNIKLNVKNASYESIPIGELQTDIRIEKEDVLWKNLRSHIGEQKFSSSSGFYNWKKNLVETHIDAKNINRDSTALILSQFHFEFLSSINGEIKEANGMLKIPVDQAKDMSFKGPLKLSNVEYKKEKIFTKLSTLFDYEDYRFQIKNLDLEIEDLSLQGKIDYTLKDHEDFLSLKNQLSLSLKSHKNMASTNQFNSIPFFSKELDALKVMGKVDLDLDLEGKLDKLKGHIYLNLRDLSYQQFPLYPFEFRTYIENSQAQVFLNQSGGTFLGRFNINLKEENMPFTWFFRFHQFDLKPLATKYFQTDPRNYLYLDAESKLEGEFMDFWNSEGYLSIENLHLAFFPEDKSTLDPFYMKNDEARTVLISKKRWHFAEERPLQISNKHAVIQIMLNNTILPEQIGMDLKAFLDLRSLPQVIPFIQSAEGALALEAEIKGSLDKPDFDAHIYNQDLKSKGLSLNFEKFKPGLENINVDVFIKNKKVLVKNIRAEKGWGNFHIQGNYDFSSEYSDNSHLDITMDNATFDILMPYFNTVPTDLSGKIRVSGFHRPYRVEGNIEITRAQTERFLDLEKEIIKTFSNSVSSPVTFKDKKNPLLDFNLAIEAKKTVNIQSRSFSATLSSKLALTGSEVSPILLGQVDIDEGKFRYKRDFEFTRGEILFDNPIMINPKLNISAKSQVGVYSVTILISGEASKPLVDILVDPSTKDDGSAISRLDAIILLSTGRLPEVESREQDTRSLVVSTGLNLYATQIPFDKFNEITGQKFLSPYMNYTTDDQGNPVPQLNLAVYISNFVEAIIQQIPNKTSAIVQIPLHDNISLSGTASSTQRTDNNIRQESQTQSVVDLKFTFPFK